ncbi:DUF4268 domain-containing protein [Barnesiella viscericola]|uniref:DUF4268 domain-containing protein n=1 Tax=Barnesiella viscericola TaxID=397865 RepID=UPI002355E6EE|nr:DUF4268 domain-containing protein [Barnesiella viscericola]
MSTSIRLSKITKVDLRSCWENEATDFTPWLASEENIALLADALGMNELEVKSQEEHVGPFRADILCVDSGTDKLVLIENQLEKTDHNHLGQILTYAAGLDAVTIIWIAERFTEEHRAAIDWLNRITDKDFNFFGIEIQLIKIGDSPAAPVFNIIAKPNGWTKDVRTSNQTSKENHTDAEIARYEFWSAFCEYMSNNPSKKFRTQSPSYSHWMNIAIGRSSFQICLLLNAREQKITIQLYLGDDIDKNYFDALYKHKEEAEAAIGEKLDWRRLEGKKTSTIDLYKRCDFTKKTTQMELFEWFKEYTEKFVSYFKPIIKAL